MYNKNILKKSMGLLYTKVFSRCEEHLENISYFSDCEKGGT